ncbi:hypothetical protein J6590_062767 [Homalodisca vitripennis]|nr:hypothetical protein J6590_062767 [Homalodisca vitripennis]
MLYAVSRRHCLNTHWSKRALTSRLMVLIQQMGARVASRRVQQLPAVAPARTVSPGFERKISNVASSNGQGSARWMIYGRMITLSRLSEEKTRIQFRKNRKLTEAKRRHSDTVYRGRCVLVTGGPRWAAGRSSDKSRHSDTVYRGRWQNADIVTLYRSRCVLRERPTQVGSWPLPRRRGRHRDTVYRSRWQNADIVTLYRSRCVLRGRHTQAKHRHSDTVYQESSSSTKRMRGCNLEPLLSTSINNNEVLTYSTCREEGETMNKSQGCNQYQESSSTQKECEDVTSNPCYLHQSTTMKFSPAQLRLSYFNCIRRADGDTSLIPHALTLLDSFLP